MNDLSGTGHLVIPASEVGRSFGQIRAAAIRAPVMLTHHGRQTHVLMTRERYEEMAQEASSALAALPATDLQFVLEWLPQAVLAVDTQGIVLFANRAAYALIAVEPDMAGHALETVAPQMAGSLIATLLQRALRYGETCSADLPSPFRADAWLRLELRPSASQTIVYLSDITDEIGRTRLADQAAARLDGVRMHSGIAQLTLNQRGHVVAADAAACEVFGIAQDRLVGLALGDVVPRQSRIDYRVAFERLCAGVASLSLRLDLLAGGVEVVPFDATLVAMIGAFGVEGAILTLVRTSDDDTCPTQTATMQS